MHQNWSILLMPSSDLLARRLAEAHGLHVLLTGDLYDAAEGSFALEVVRQQAGPMLVVGQYYHRAAYWMMRLARVPGRRADKPGAASSVGRDIRCVDTTGLTDEQIEARITAITGECILPGSVTDLRETLPERWHPVIDYDRCVNCLQCAEFCLFGVYGVDEKGTAKVSNPQLCKPGCPACSRICPAGAIMFPRYHARGPIAGADEGLPPQVPAEHAREVARPDVEAYMTRHHSPLSPEALLKELDEEL